MTTTSRLVSPGSVVDTTTDPAWVPVRVEAVLAQPVVGLPRDPMHLDGPLAWCAYIDGQMARAREVCSLPPMREWAHDFVMPLATWTAACTQPDPDPRLLAADGISAWGWACSRAEHRAVRHDVAWVRRKPELGQMAFWTAAGRHHIGLGPRRAQNVPHQAVWVDRLRWWALADPTELERLLSRLTHVGRLARHGWGQILTAAVAEDPEASTRWRDRDMPGDGPQQAIRAPYHHPSRKMPCQLR